MRTSHISTRNPDSSEKADGLHSKEDEVMLAARPRDLGEGLLLRLTAVREQEL